jgi:hypothetical protein
MGEKCAKTKEKTTFQWMLDNDNAALEKRYYRALDDLIKFLDRSKVETELTTTLYTIWTNSEAFKATHHLMIRTVKEFDSVFPINSRLLLLKLALVYQIVNNTKSDLRRY